nr:AsmA-like C-terminal region-containing protein [Mesorhizobium albiziae]
MARLFVIVGGLIVLVLTAALVGPYFVNWTSYRADFEREATAILGRRVTVEGGVTARLLPFPSLTFSDVVVAGTTPDKPAVTAETFSMDGELAPFLRGEVLIFDMRLVRPKVTIDVAEDGTVDWAVRPSSPFSASNISLEKLTVTEGQVSINHAAGGRTHALSEINAQISARSLAGPWRADGTLRIDDMPTALSVSTGKADETGAMRLRIKANPESYPLAIEADGDARLDKGRVLYAGTFRLGAGAPEQAELRSSDGGTFNVATEKPAREALRPNRIGGKFSFDHRRLGIDEFRFETGPVDDPYTADGKAFIELGANPRFSIEASGAQVRFDEAAGGEKTAGFTLKERLAAVQRALVDLPKPTIPGTVDVNLPAVVAGDTTIRDVRLSAEPAEAGWDVKSLAATLPGRTKLEGSGLLRTSGEFGFAGSLLLAVAQPSGFAAWVAKDVDDAIRRMPAAGFRADVDMTTQLQRFSNLELILGAAKFRGEVVNRQPDDALPSMQVKLAGEALDVDGMAAFASLFVSEKGASRLADRDLDLDIKAGPVSAAGLTAETVDTALRLRGGTLEIDRLSIGGLEGATISATGTVKEFPNKPSGKLDASVIAVDLEPLISALAENYPANPLVRELRKRTAEYPGLFADTQIDVVASAASNGDGTSSVDVSASGNAGGSDLSLQVSANGNPTTPEAAEVTLSYTAKNDNAEPLLALYGLPTLPLGVAGNGDTTVRAKGTLAGGLDTTASFSGADAKAEFEGRITAWNDALTVKGKIQVDASDIEPWLMTAGIGLPGLGFGLPLALAADADYSNGVLSLAGLTGTVEEGAVSGDIKAELKDGLPHISGALALDEIDLGIPTAMVVGETALDSDGEGGWPQAAFQERISAPFTADLNISAGTLSAGPAGNAGDVRMTARLDREGLRLADVSGKAYDGQVSGLFELKNTDGTGLFSAQLKFTGADLGMMLADTGLAGRADVTATVSTTGKSVDAMVSALSGSGTAALHGLTIAGVNPDAFSAIIAQADAVGRDIDAAKTAEFAPQIAGAGSFAAKDSELAFSIAGGVLRAPPMTLEASASSLTAEVRADLNSGTMAAEGTIVYQPGDEKLVGSEPVVRFTVEGPFGALAKQFDTDPLAQFLTQRALELEQARVEAMQAALLEKQRLRREVRYYASLQEERDRVAEELRRADEALRLKAEEEAKRKAEEAARAAAEAEEAERQKAAEEALGAAQRQAEEEAAQRAAEAIRLVERERARQEAERNAAKPAREVEQAPLPPIEPRDLPQPNTGSPKPTRPFIFENILRSLGQ